MHNLLLGVCLQLLSHQLSRADVHHLVGEDTPHGRLVHDQSVSRWHQLKLSANVCRENMTQTPDDWMMDVPEPVFTPEEIAALRSRQQGATPASHLSSSSGDARLTQELSAVSEDEAMQMSRDDADPPPRPGQPPSTKFSLNVEMAQHLVAFIYESRMVDIASDKSAIDFSEGPPFLEYIKQVRTCGEDFHFPAPLPFISQFLLPAFSRLIVLVCIMCSTRITRLFHCSCS